MIRIINGTYGYRNPTTNQVEAKNAKSKPFSLSSEREEDLVRSGVAEYVGEDEDDGKEDDGEAAPATSTAKGSGTDGDEVPKYSARNKLEELVAIAQQYGIEVPATATKKQIIELIDAKRAAGEDEDDGKEDDGEAAPALSALMPE